MPAAATLGLRAGARPARGAPGPRSTTLTTPRCASSPGPGFAQSPEATGLAGPRRPPRRLAATVVGATAAAVILGAWGAPALAQKGDPAAGKPVYELRCASCHGVKGDGKGPGADLLVPPPRDFTTGVYKIRSTADKVPSDDDLFRIITSGMPGTSMPGWAVLPERDRWNLVAYIKAFAADRFARAPRRLELPPEAASSAESIKRGQEMYEAIECHKCHGTAGRADGPSRPELKDDWGHPIAPANLTKRWTFRGGAGRGEIAMRIAAGALGTPMPSFQDSVEKPEDIWHLANFIASLGPESVRYATLLTGTATREALPDDPDAEFWKRLPPQPVPLMGQVIVDPRNFNPAIDLVSVRVAYNEREVAFHLTWDDPGESRADPAQKVFADAVSLQFAPRPGSGGERPYFLMGGEGDPVYLLRWEQGRGVQEATAEGPARVKPLEGSEAAGKAVFQDGQYRLVMKRPLAARDDRRPAFQPGAFTPVAVQAWEGGAGETGTRMSLTSWYYLRLEEPQSSRRFVVPPVVALFTLAVMLVVVRVANRRT